MGSIGYRRLTVALGAAFIIGGLAVNRFTLAPLSSDGEITGWTANLAILLLQVAMIGYGVHALRARHSHIVEVSLLVTSLPVAFVLLEFSWRLYLFGGDALSYRKMISLRSVGESGMLQASDRPGIVFELKPSLDQLFKLVEFRTNAKGLRDDDHALEKPVGTYRVAVVGDSYTMASGVSVEDAYPSVLESRLRAEWGSPVEVLNFGVGGYTLRHYLAVIEHKALRYAPDVIVIGFCPENDHQVPPEGMLQRKFQPREPLNAFWRSHVLQFVSDLRRAQPKSVITPRQKDYMQDVLTKISAVGRATDVPIVVAYLANRPGDVATVEAVVRSSGLQWVDAGRSIASGELRNYSIYYPLDTHPNEAAHQAFADALNAFITQLRLTTG